MPPKHCPDEIVVGGERCQRYEDFVDPYLGGCLKFEVCLYRCPDNKVHVRAQMKICGVSVGDVQTYTIDLASSAPTGTSCADTIRVGRDQCRLVDAYELDFGFGVKVRVCAYVCGELLYAHGVWRTSFCGVECAPRERSTYPFPI